MTTITMEKHILKRLDALEDFAKEIRAALAAPATAPEQPERKPMTDEEVIDLVRECGLDWHKGFMPLFDDDPTNRFAVLVRAVEAFHDIKENKS